MATGSVSPKTGKVVDIPNTTVTIGTATSGALSASVAFTATTSAVGGPTFSYIATSSPGSITGSATTSPITVSGLTAGTAYTFTVAATNPTGSGVPSSASNSVTPYVLPTVTGGTLYSDATYYYRKFTSNGTLGISGNSLALNYMMIAGGGSGGNNQSGGGGAGGLVAGSSTLAIGSYSIVIGGGGAGTTGNPGNVGSDTTFTGMTTALGGGRDPGRPAPCW